MKLLTGCVALLTMLIAGCPLPEMGGRGQPCFDSDDPCNQGLVCRPMDEVCIIPECTDSSDCPAGQTCDLNEFACKTGGTGCQSDDDCAMGYFCDLGDHQCKPETGDRGEVGDPCPFDNPSDEYPVMFPDAPPCDDGLQCIGYFPSPDNGICGVPNDCWMMRLEINAACLNGHCGGAMCMEPCGAGDTCEPGFRPIETMGGDCYCGHAVEDTGCDPVYQYGCTGGEKCIPFSNAEEDFISLCIPAGEEPIGGSCSWPENFMCVSGAMCLDNTCYELCSVEPDSCPSGGCSGWPGTNWGICPPP